MEKKVAYKCKVCLIEKDRKEFHYEQFESLNPKKICWSCEKKKYEREIKDVAKDIIEDYKSQIIQLKNKISKLERINSIKLPAPKESITKSKHHSLNIWMEEGNRNQAWLLHKGQLRLYRTYPNQYIENDSVIVYKKSDGAVKYYGLQNMHNWIFEKETSTMLS